MNLASFIYLISKLYALASSEPTVKFKGSVGFQHKAWDLLGKNTFPKGVSPLYFNKYIYLVLEYFYSYLSKFMYLISYSTILLSIPVAAIILG